MGENRASQPQHVGFDDFYGFLSVSDMYTEWRDPYFFPEIVYSDERTEWIKNQPFNQCFVHATAGRDAETSRRSPSRSSPRSTTAGATTRSSSSSGWRAPTTPWFLYHCTRGAHFDNYPHERFLGVSPARHPYKDTIVELDDIVGRLLATLDATGQLDDTFVFVSSDNGPEMETWPDAAYSPFRCAKGSTWEGGVRVPALFTWPGVIDAGPSSDGLFAFTDLLPTVATLAGCADDHARPTGSSTGSTRRRSCSPPTPRSNRKYQYYWLLDRFSARARRRVQVHARRRSPTTTTTCSTPAASPASSQHYPYGRLYNLYLDPKETRSYLIRKLAYLEFVPAPASASTSPTFRDYPAQAGGGRLT